MTGNGFTTLSVEIYSRARRGVSLEINALSTLVFLFALVLVVGYYYISKDNQPRSKKKETGALAMKKLRSLLIGICLIIGLLFLGTVWLERSTGMSDAKVLNIYNWGDYIDPKLITKFEKQTGYKVNYETFDSNEAMLTKIKQGGTSYDIAVPSDYMIQKDEKRASVVKTRS